MKNSELQKDNQRLNDLVKRLQDEKQSANFDMNLYEHMIGERDREIHQYKHQLSEKDQKISQLMNQGQFLFHSLVHVKTNLERLIHPQ